MERDITWREIFDQAPIALSLIDVDGRQIAGNSAYAAMLGYSPAEVNSLEVANLTRPDDKVWTSSYLTALVNGERDEFITEKKYLCSNGSELHARLTARPLRRADGTCWGILGVLRPVESREQVEDARLRRLLQYTEASLTLVDADGNVLETSGRYQTLLGYPPEFWESRSVFDLVANGLEDVLDFRNRLLSSADGRLGIEIQVLAADGSIQDLLVKAVNLLDDPDVRGIALTTVNVTEQRRLVEGLHHRTTTAEAVAEAQTLLLATVSHELRNPLHAVQGLAELLASEHLPPRAAELASTLARQISGLADVTQDLLDTARIASGTVELHPVPTDLRALVDEVVGFGDAMSGDHPLAITSSFSADAPHWVAVDHVRLRQILRNLVGNAVKFTSTGSVTVSVTVDSRKRVTFAVADTGVGIHEDDLDRVLEPFGTGSTAASQRGAGLGLAIVQRLVTAMGGTLSVTSRPNHGSTFTVCLSLPAATEPITVRERPQASGLTVLVVEDNVVNQKLAQSQLDRLGMTPIIVPSGEDALSMLATPSRPAIDVILMDHQLPGIDGTETTRRLRLLDQPTASIPVICLTASASAKDRERFLNSGMNGFVSKPATMSDIRSAIDQVMQAKPPVEPVQFASVAPHSEEHLNVDTGVLERLAEEFTDHSIVELLVQTFLDELPSRRDALIVELTNPEGDPSAAAHVLKSSSLLLGANRLGILCQAIEKNHRPDLGHLQAVIEGTSRELRAWLARQ